MSNSPTKKCLYLQQLSNFLELRYVSLRYDKHKKFDIYEWKIEKTDFLFLKINHYILWPICQIAKRATQPYCDPHSTPNPPKIIKISGSEDQELTHLPKKVLEVGHEDSKQSF